MNTLADINLIAWGFLGVACLVSVVLIAKGKQYFAPPQPAEPKNDDGDAPLFDDLPIRVSKPVVQTRSVEEANERILRLSSQLQENIETLRQLIVQSDQAVERLEQAIAAAAAVPAPSAVPEPAAVPTVRESSEVEPVSPSPAGSASQPPASEPSRSTQEDVIGIQLLKDRSVTRRRTSIASQAGAETSGETCPPTLERTPVDEQSVAPDRVGLYRRLDIPEEPAEEEPRPLSQAEALRPAQAIQSRTTASPPSRPASSAGREQRYNEIYVLADYGHSLPEIAHRMAVPVGEVELILSLRDKR